MTCSMWAPWDPRTAWRRNTKFCTTRVSIPLVTCAQLSLILSFSSGRVQGALLNTLSFWVLLQVTIEFLRKACPLLCTQLSDWKTWILYGCMRRSFRSMRHAVGGDTSFSVANCRTDFRVGDETTLARNCPNSVGRANTWLAPASFLACLIPSCARPLHHRLHRTPCWSFLALLLVFEPALDCDNRICLQKLFHNLSFLLCL